MVARRVSDNVTPCCWIVLQINTKGIVCVLTGQQKQSVIRGANDQGGLEAADGCGNGSIIRGSKMTQLEMFAWAFIALMTTNGLGYLYRTCTNYEGTPLKSFVAFALCMAIVGWGLFIIL